VGDCWQSLRFLSLFFVISSIIAFFFT
jgi:hypothetical protein